MDGKNWRDLGPVENFSQAPLTEVELGRVKIAVSFRDGKFGVVSGVCNHVGGPLGQGQLQDDYIVCPWHHWKFHRVSGKGEPGFEEDAVPSYEFRVENGHLHIAPEPVTTRSKKPHEAHPLARKVMRANGPIRIVGISTTAMDAAFPRYSTSDALLEAALESAKSE